MVADAVNAMKRRILRSLAAFALGMFAFERLAPAAEMPRGGRVAWARLITESSSWSVHDANDRVLADFIRTETSLNVDPKCYAADPADLAQLCAYPFIFTNNLTNVHDPRRLANIREYLRRGGFIYIDRCVNLSFSLEQEPFYARHVALFRSFLPGCEIRDLPENHEIHRCYFTLPSLNRGSSSSNHSGIYGVYFEGRLAVLLSCANLQCGWPNSPTRSAQSKREIANIYVYAMTRGEVGIAQSP
jgi:hypothetical protein